MPTYQYACTACAERLEVVQSFTDAPLTECPSCGGTLRKVFSPVGVVFKGSGFYKTDSRSKPSSGSSSDGKSDSAPAAPGTSAGSSDSSGSSAAPSGSSGSSDSSGSSGSSSSGSSSAGSSAAAS